MRLCDGRYFPLPRSSGANAAQLCSSFCPAATTKVFSGGGIDHAGASDGTRYGNLPNAFVYRDKIVDGCSCNGRDPYGLVTLNAEADPTLRNGDIVATNQGFVAYHGGARRNAEFTPIENYSGLSAEWRQRLSETKIVPANATPVPPTPSSEGATRSICATAAFSSTDSPSTFPLWRSMCKRRPRAAVCVILPCPSHSAAIRTSGAAARTSASTCCSYLTKFSWN